MRYGNQPEEGNMGGPWLWSEDRAVKSKALLFLVLSQICACSAHGRPGPDTFDVVQENVWYLPTENSKVDLYVTEMGKGPPVVVLHGGPGNDFNYLVPALRPLADSYRFVLFDQRGSLLSPVPSEEVKKLTLDVLVEDLERLRVALGQDRLVLFAHSFGTLLALRYSETHPNRVAGLILAASFPPRTTKDRTLLEVIRAGHDRIQKLRTRPQVEAELKRAKAFGDRKSLSPQASANAFRIRDAGFFLVHVDRWRSVQGGGVYYSGAVDDAIGDSIPLVYDGLTPLASTGVPVSVIQGDQDYADPSASLWIGDTGRSGQVEISVLPSAGHYSWVDAPGEFEAALSHALHRAAGPRP
jgi:pimeloyl-ACP methyl ester carboxylesterase